MRLIYFTDPHIQVYAPISRRDSDYVHTILNKIRYVMAYARDNKADLVVCGGDLFNRADPVLSVLREFTQVVTYFDVPFYTCVGNHDLFGHQALTFPRTAIGLLDAAGVAKTGGDSGVIIDGMVIVFGDFYDGIEKGLSDFTTYPVCDVLIPHAMVTPGSFFGDFIEYNNVESVFRVMLCSHYHPGFPTYVSPSGKHIIAPGALTRTSMDAYNLTRTPAFVDLSIDANNISYNIIELPLDVARPADQVFYMEEVVPTSTLVRKDLLAEMNALEMESYDVQILIGDCAKKMNVRDQVKEEAIKRVSE